MFHNVGRRLMIWWGRALECEWYAIWEYKRQRQKQWKITPSDD